ncbi:MAG: hypothetical protein V2G42_03525 [bacterium JZ-2024 1]
MAEPLNGTGLVDLVFRQLEDCGAGGGRCLMLRYLMQGIEREMSPWELAHYILTSPYPNGASTFLTALRAESPVEATKVDGLILASAWNRESEEVRADFGSD